MHGTDSTHGGGDTGVVSKSESPSAPRLPVLQAAFRRGVRSLSLSKCDSESEPLLSSEVSDVSLSRKLKRFGGGGGRGVRDFLPAALRGDGLNGLRDEDASGGGGDGDVERPILMALSRVWRSQVAERHEGPNLSRVDTQVV